jgi:hypothetical protein
MDASVQDKRAGSEAGDLLTPAASVFLEAFGDRIAECIRSGLIAVTEGGGSEQFEQSFSRLEEDMPTGRIRHAANTFLRAKPYGKGTLLFEAYMILMALERFRKGVPEPIYRRLSQRGKRFLDVVLPMVSGELDALGIDHTRLSVALLDLQRDPGDRSAAQVADRAMDALEPAVTRLRGEVMATLGSVPAVVSQAGQQQQEAGKTVDVVPKHGQANGEGSVASPDERQPARRGPRTGIGLPIIRYAYAEKERRGVLTAPDAAPSVRVILPRQHLDVLLQFVDHRGNPVDPPSEKRICTRARDLPPENESR